MSLRRRLAKLACDVPETRKYIVPLLRGAYKKEGASRALGLIFEGLRPYVKDWNRFLAAVEKSFSGWMFRWPSKGYIKVNPGYWDTTGSENFEGYEIPNQWEIEVSFQISYKNLLKGLLTEWSTYAVDKRAFKETLYSAFSDTKTRNRILKFLAIQFKKVQGKRVKVRGRAVTWTDVLYEYSNVAANFIEAFNENSDFFTRDLDEELFMDPLEGPSLTWVDAELDDIVGSGDMGSYGEITAYFKCKMSKDGYEDLNDQLDQIERAEWDLEKERKERREQERAPELARERENAMRIY